MKKLEVMVMFVFLAMVLYSGITLFKELATVRPNVEKILLNK